MSVLFSSRAGFLGNRESSSLECSRELSKGAEAVSCRCDLERKREVQLWLRGGYPLAVAPAFGKFCITACGLEVEVLPPMGGLLTFFLSVSHFLRAYYKG